MTKKDKIRMKAINECLTLIQQKILVLYYCDKLTQQVIAKKLSIAQPRISEILKDITEQLEIAGLPIPKKWSANRAANGEVIEDRYPNHLIDTFYKDKSSDTVSIRRCSDMSKYDRND